MSDGDGSESGAAGAAGGVEVLPLPDPLVDASALRGSILASSLLGLRELGHEERYFEVLDRAAEPTMRAVPAGSWVPMQVALAHYGAVEALALESREIEQLGARVADRMHRGVMGTILRRLRAAGLVTPWSILPRMGFLWSRAVQGGGLRLVRISETSSVLGVHRFPPVRYGSLRASLAANLSRTFELLARDIEVTEEWVRHDSCGYYFRWSAHR